jgi:transcriptional regulator with XRE-family HTH domain
MSKGQRLRATWQTEGFPAWLTARMDARQWNTVQLGRALGVDPSLVSRYLSGERLPSQASMHAMARAFQLPVQEVWVATGHVPPDAVPDDPRRRDLVRTIADLDLTDEQYRLLTELLEALRVASKAAAASEPA